MMDENPDRGEDPRIGSWRTHGLARRDLARPDPELA